MCYISSFVPLYFASIYYSPLYGNNSTKSQKITNSPFFRWGRVMLDDPLIRDILRLSVPEFIEYRVYMLLAHLIFNCSKGFSRLGEL